jgi:hypothetical protein
MHAKKINAFSERLRKLALDIAQGDVSPVEGRFRTVSGGKVKYTLSGLLLETYETICSDLLIQCEWSDKFSEGYLNKAIDDILCQTLNKDCDMAFCLQQFDVLVSEYEQFQQEQIVYIPLSGVRMQVDLLMFGDVTLTHMTPQRLEQLSDKIEHIVTSRRETPVQHNQLVAWHRREVLAPINGRVCGVCTIIAEPIRAKELAEASVRLVLDLLRFAIPFIYRDDQTVFIGLQGEVSRDVRMTPMVTADASMFNWQSELVGPQLPFDITEKTIIQMKQIGVFDVATLLSQETLTEYQETLLRGIHWFANSQTQDESENILLGLITCIETFLTPRDGGPVTTAIAESIAIIGGKDLASRKLLKKKVKGLYRLRSRISHGGKKAILDADLAALRQITAGLTMTMIQKRNDFETITAFLEWIEDQKLS